MVGGKWTNKLWDGLKHRTGIALGTLITVILGTTMRGDWILLVVHFLKQNEETVQLPADGTTAGETGEYDGLNWYLSRVGLQNAHWFCCMALTISYVTYHGLAGWLHWYFYVRRRHQAKEWKCQPERFLTPENERHEILLGSLNMAIGGTLSGIGATYIMNGGYTTLYYTAGEKGWLYLLLSSVFLFLITDAYAFYLHKLGHHPWIYRHIHKHHHRYHSPTAWSATAMHPVEFVIFQLAIMSPILYLPIYSGSFIGLLFYGYYYGMIDHSGVYMEAVWPWQPSSIFHDDHHKYFHTNYGFNLKLWDWLHDTLRKENRVYTEETFGGKGKAIL